MAQPSLTAYLPDPATATGTAVIVCPGGAWHFLAIQHEGIDVAAWLNAHGVAAFVLKYRLIRTGADWSQEKDQNLRDRERLMSLMAGVGPMVVADGQQAVRVVRQRAAEWGLAPDRIGMMGFSAGGMVTASVALNHDSGSRPDFAAPIYTARFGDSPVPGDAPPLFLACAADDDMAVPLSLRLYGDWRAAGHAAELHIYAGGGHGFGMRKQGLPSDTWIERFADWLGALGMLGDSPYLVRVSS